MGHNPFEDVSEIEDLELKGDGKEAGKLRKFACDSLILFFIGFNNY